MDFCSDSSRLTLTDPIPWADGRAVTVQRHTLQPIYLYTPA